MITKDDAIKALIQDKKHLEEEIEFQEDVISVLLQYFQFETGINSLERYLNTRLDDSLESTELFLHIMDRVI